MHSPVVLGLDFGGTKIAGAVSDMTGFRLGSMTIDTCGSDGAQTSLARGLLAARSLLDSSARGRPLAAVGACTIGIPSENGISLAPTIPGWGTLVLDRELRRVFESAEIRLATVEGCRVQGRPEWGRPSAAIRAYSPRLSASRRIVANGACNALRRQRSYNLRHPPRRRRSMTGCRSRCGAAWR